MEKEKVITVFDIATPEELFEMFGDDDDNLYNEIKDDALTNPDCNYSNFAALYSVRGDLPKAERFADRITDIERRQFAFRMINHP